MGHFGLLSLLFVTGCVAKNSSTSSTTPSLTGMTDSGAENQGAEEQEDETGADAEDSAAEEPSPAAEVFSWLEGNFDSTRQASSNPTYYEISLRMCTFELSELGDHLLYVEQALVSDPANPYRQRVYRVENVDGLVASHVYSIDATKEAELVGACDDPDSIEIDLDQVSERAGCTVWLEHNDGEYVGGTDGTGCESALAGAAYATSEVLVGPTRIESLDRGWTSTGVQAWGATDGPYIFDRLD